MRKTYLMVLTVMGLCVAVAGNAFAANATRNECIAMVREAAELLNTSGVEPAIKEINKRDGRFVWKDSYVFLMDLDGKMLAHPVKPELTEKEHLLLEVDPNGKALFVHFVNLAKNQGEGWVDYLWPKPGETIPSKKVTYIYRIPGTEYFLGAGIYTGMMH